MHALRLAVLALAALASVATSAPVDPLPEPDSCNSPQLGAPVDLLEIGGEAGPTAPFEAYAEGATVTPIIGGQGSPMVPLRLRIAGDAPPACLPQTTNVRDALTGEQLGSESSPLTTYDLGDGTRGTDTLYLPLYYNPGEGRSIELEVEAGGRIATVTLTLASP